VRTCANCHVINAVDQLGRPTPTNAPLALRQLLRLWRTNSANAYSLSVSNGTGGGTFGAGCILTLTANPAPPGKLFSQWLSSGVSNPASPTILFIMPTNNAVVTAVYTDIPAPVFTGWQIVGGTNVSLTAQTYPTQPWVLQTSSDLTNWVGVRTNYSDSGGIFQISIAVNPGTPTGFFRLKSP
jgi:hypothetical protein